MSEERKTCLLIGGGFLGKYFIQDWLASNPYSKIIVLDRVESEIFYTHEMIAPYKKDNRLVYLWGNSGDPDRLKQYLEQGIDCVVYTAAIADVGYCENNPNDAWRINVENTKFFMNWLGSLAFKGRIVLMSSESVYKKKVCLPVKDYPEDAIAFKETDPLEPHSVYGQTKMYQENVAREAATKCGLRLVVIRSATMYGPYGRKRQVILDYIRQVLELENISIMGTGTETSRDFVNVMDTVKAINSILKADNSSVDGETFNIGTGRETFLLNLANAIKELVGQPSEPFNKQTGAPRPGFKPIINLDFRKGEKGARIVLDISKAKEKLRMIDKNGNEGPWEPEIDLIYGLKNTIYWMASQVGYDEKGMENVQDMLFPERRIGKKYGST